MDLYDAASVGHNEPLAARMRPRTLDEFIGQSHIIGEGRLLRRAIKTDRLTSVIFYGPPGVGKTTLAKVISLNTGAKFITLNAVLSGVKETREAIAEAQEQKRLFGRKTILFVDEVHRWNKAQQDALLPWTESGVIVLIGATTENPYFEVNRALVSRSRVFQLLPLSEADLSRAIDLAITDKVRGYGLYDVCFEPGAKECLVNVSNGDCRTLYNALELAVESSSDTFPPQPGALISITLSAAEDSIQKKALLYDKDGDYHFDTISAFIKSVRGSDPDAALYWLARMVSAGEDVEFIWRRLLILASEDVGLADSNAVSVVAGCADAYRRMGMPEGRYPLAHATLYLATAPKSNSVMGFFDALKLVESERQAEVPLHLKDASRDGEAFGHGQGYKYPHAFTNHWTAQAYLPAALKGKVFYQPSSVGHEGALREEIFRRREEQLALILEEETSETLTFSPAVFSYRQNVWLKRAEGEAKATLRALREAFFNFIGPERHAVSALWGDEAGYFTAEAMRRSPEGGVYAFFKNDENRAAVESAYASLDLEERPTFSTLTLDRFDPADYPAFDTVLLCLIKSDPAVLSGYVKRLAGLGSGVALVREEPVRLSALMPSSYRAALVGVEPPTLFEAAFSDVVKRDTIALREARRVDNVRLTEAFLDNHSPYHALDPDLLNTIKTYLNEREGSFIEFDRVFRFLFIKRAS